MARPRAFDEAEVLQKALDTFCCRGYGATSVEDLVAGTGLNRASLYATFGDKHQLFVRVFRQYEQCFRQSLTALTAEVAAPAPEQLRQVLQQAADLALADDKGCLMVNTIAELVPHDAEVQGIAHDGQAFIETSLTEILRQGQQRGEVRPNATPQAQARLLVSVLNGMRIVAKANPDPQLLRDVVETALLAVLP